MCGIGTTMVTISCEAVEEENNPGIVRPWPLAGYVVHNFNWLPLSLSTVDGGWSQWGEWSRNCSDNCTGEMERFRQCGSPRPVGSGKYCEGRNNEIQPCPCPGQIKGGYRPVFCSVSPPDYLGLLTSIQPSEDRDKVVVWTVQYY